MSGQDRTDIARGGHSPGRSVFFGALEASRGIAALSVALFHTAQWVLISEALQAHPSALARAETTAMRIVGNGHGAVIYFFVLSGFVLSLMLERGPQGTAAAARSFFVGRIFRIYPAIFATLVLFVIVFAIWGKAFAGAEAYSFSNWIANALLLRTDLNGVMWSLQLEMIAAPFIFLGYLASRRWGPLVLYIPLIVFAALSFVSSWSKGFGTGAMLGPLFAFFAGMIAYFVARPMTRGMPYKGWALIAALMLFAVARPVIGWASTWAVIVEVIAASWIVLLLADERYTFETTLAGRLCRFYGRISYSFYLLHPLTVMFIISWEADFRRAVGDGWDPFALSIIAFVISTAIITPLAWLQNVAVERTGQRMGHQLQTSGVRTQPTVAMPRRG